MADAAHAAAGVARHGDDGVDRLADARITVVAAGCRVVIAEERRARDAQDLDASPSAESFPAGVPGGNRPS